MIQDIYILDPAEKLKVILSNDGSEACPILDDSHKEKLNNAFSTYEFEIPADHADSALIQKKDKVLFQDVEGKYLLFKIEEIWTGRTASGEKTKKFYAETLALELLGNIIRPVTLQGVTQAQALDHALAGTRFERGVVDFAGAQTFKFTAYLTTIDFINKMLLQSTFNSELQIRFEFDGQKITRRLVDLIARRGRDKGQVIEYGKNLAGISKTESSKEIYTALIGVGPADDAGNLLTFKDLNKPDSPTGQDWVGDEEARQLYGVPQADGSKAHFFGVYTYGGDNQGLTAEKLYTNTKAMLAKVVTPADTYEINHIDLARQQSLEDHELVVLGDGVNVRDFDLNPEILLYTRVIEVERSYVNPAKNKYVFGSFIEGYTNSEGSRLRDIEQKILEGEGAWRKTGLTEVTDADFPDVIPAAPSVTATGGFKTIFLEWEFWPASYIAKYEVYGSETSGFAPAPGNLLWEGKASGFAHDAGNSKTFYYKVRAVNTRGSAGSFSQQVSASTVKIMTDEMLFGSVNADILADLAVTAGKLADGSVTTPKMADLAVNNAKLAALAVDAAKLADGAVTTLKIFPDAVTNEKIADLAVQAGQLANGAVLEGKLGDLAVTAAKLAAGAVTDTKIANLAVGNAKLAALAVDAAKLADDAVTNAKIGPAAVNSTEIADSAVLTGKLAALAVDATKLANGAVTDTKILDGAVTNLKIGNNAVNNAKLANLAVDAAKLADGAVIDTKIANLAVGNAKLAALAVDAAKLADSAVTATKIANLAVGSAAIANLAVTNGKIANLAVDTAQLADAAITTAKIANLAVGNAAIANASIDNAKISRISADVIATTSPNLILPGWDSFEQFDGSVPSSNAGNVLSKNVSTEAFYVGTKSMKYISNANASSYVYVGSSAGFVNAKAGETYIASAYVMTTDDTASAHISLSGRNSAAVAFQTASKGYTITKEMGWTRISVKTTLTEPTIEKLSLFVRNQLANSTIFWDALQVERVESIQNEPTDWKPSGTTFIWGGNLTAQSVTAAQMAVGSITAANGAIANLAVGTAAIADSAITNAKIENLAVTAAKIANLTVTDAQIASLAVTNAKIADLAVNTAELADAAITTAKIANLAVGNAAIANLAVTNGKIGALAVDTAQLADAAITAAKIENLAVGTAAIAALAVDAGKIKDLAVGTAAIANLAVTNAKIGALAVDTAQIADAAITTAKIENLAVGNAAIANAAITNAKLDRASVNKIAIGTADIVDLNVTGAKIANLAVGNAAIANLAVTSGKIGNLAVGSAQIADLAVTEAKIANLAIDTAKIKDGAITNAKIQNLDASKITVGTLTGITISGVTITGALGTFTDTLTLTQATGSGLVFKPSWVTSETRSGRFGIGSVTIGTSSTEETVFDIIPWEQKLGEDKGRTSIYGRFNVYSYVKGGSYIDVDPRNGLVLNGFGNATIGGSDKHFLRMNDQADGNFLFFGPNLARTAAENYFSIFRQVTDNNHTVLNNGQVRIKMMGAQPARVQIRSQGDTAYAELQLGHLAYQSQGQFSDRRLKENIIPFEEKGVNALKEISALKVYTFQYKDDKQKRERVGGIHDEAPDLIRIDGQETEGNAIDTGNLTWLNTKALQDLIRKLLEKGVISAEDLSEDLA